MNDTATHPGGPFVCAGCNKPIEVMEPAIGRQGDDRLYHANDVCGPSTLEVPASAPHHADPDIKTGPVAETWTGEMIHE